MGLWQAHKGTSGPGAESSHRSTVCRAATGPQSTPILAAAVEAEVAKEDIDVAVDRLPNSVLQLKVMVPQKQVAKAWSGAIKRYAKDLVLEGFRKGKKAWPHAPASHELH